MKCEERQLKLLECLSSDLYPFSICADAEGIEGGCIFESTIDSLSYFELHENRLHGVLLASAHGIGNFETSAEALQSVYNLSASQICFCADNYDSGNRCIEAHPEYKSMRSKSPFKDWNDVLKSKKAMRFKMRI
ncbi:MAG: toprim domain-containing protein [Clostridiales bacterium]|nr:toprim domain-containing protein [Clostridiales bacterium]